MPAEQVPIEHVPRRIYEAHYQLEIYSTREFHEMDNLHQKTILLKITILEDRQL